MSSRQTAADAPPDSPLPDPALPDPALPDPALPDPALPDPALPDPALPDSVLCAGLGVVLSVVVESALLDPALLDPALLDPALLDPALLDPAALDPAVLDPAVLAPAVLDSAALDLDGSVIGPLIAPALASLVQPTADLADPGIDPADLVTPAMIAAARRLPAEQRARLAELARAQYGLCSFGHRRSVRVVDSGRHARTQLICRTCEPDPT